MPYMPNAQVVRGMTGATGPTGATGLTGPAEGTSTLMSSTIVGDTSVSVTPAPSPYSGKGMLVGIGSGTLGCELAYVTNATAGTLTVFPALEFAHTAGDNVTFFPSGEVYPGYFGCVGDNVTDDWQGLQRLFYQVSKTLSNYRPSINGGSRTYRVKQPLTFSKQTMSQIAINCYTTFSTPDTNNALMMSASQNHYRITATAVDDVIATTSSVFPNINGCVVFNNMYGETLPGGIVAGRVYYVLTRPDAQHITVSATRGGATLDVTSDGSGWVASQIGELTKFWWDGVVLNVAIADLNGLIFGAQQPQDMYRTRVNMTVACSRTTYGMIVQQAQICRIYNPEFVVNSATNVVALGIGVSALPDATVTGVHVSDANFAGSAASGQTHIVIGGASVCDDIVLSGETWLEGAGDAGIKIVEPARGVDLGHLYLSGNPTNGAVYETATAGNASWKVGQIFNSGSNHINVKTVDGVLFKTSGSSDNVSADASQTMGGMRRVSSGVMPALQLEGRLYSSTTTSATLDWLGSTYDVDATAGTKTMTLPSAVGVATMQFTVRKKDSSGNAVTVATTSSQTINGSATYSLASQYKYVTVESDGANWIVVANN